MKSKYFTLICVFLFTTASSCSLAGQLAQRELLRLNNHNNNKYFLSKKFLNGGQLKVTQIIARHLGDYEDSRDQSDDLSIMSDKEYKKRILVSVSPGNFARSIKEAIPPHKYIDEVFEISTEYNIDPLLLHAIAEVESHFDSKAISPAGAKGLMQIMPSTARRFGMNNPDIQLLNPRDNLRICSNYLRSLYSLFGNDIPLILAAYNAGESAVIKYGNTIPPYSETQQYVTKVMKRYLELKDLSYDL